VDGQLAVATLSNLVHLITSSTKLMACGQRDVEWRFGQVQVEQDDLAEGTVMVVCRLRETKVLLMSGVKRQSSQLSTREHQFAPVWI